MSSARWAKNVKPLPRQPDPGNWSACFDHDARRLLASRQPLGRNGVSIFFAGYISNTDELAQALGRPGLADASELAWLAWAQWGCALPSHVLGAYGIAVVDHRQAALTLLQDALGQRPLFYVQSGNCSYVADTLAGLLAVAGPRPLCLDYFAAWLRFGYGATDLTPHEGMRRLIHGGHVRLRAGRAERGVAVLPRSETLPWSYTRADAEQALVYQVEQAVARECTGLRRPLFELSGGLDSSTVVALAHSRAGGRRLDALTWDSPFDDDAGHAAFLAAQLGLQHRVIARPAGDFIAWDEVDAWFEPGNEFSGALRRVLNGVLASGHDAIVTGVGGDDVFHARGAQPLWLADLLRAGRLTQAWQILHTPPPGGRPQRQFLGQLWRFGLRPLLPAAEAPGLAPHYRYGRDFMARCTALAPVDMHLPEDGSIARRNFWKNLRALVANRVAISHLSPEIPFRHPLLSLPLLEFSASVLGRFETHLQPDRTLQRTAFAGRVPDRILARTSKGGSLAQEAAYWRSDDARQRFQPESSRVVALGLVDAEQWRTLLGGAGFGRVANLREFDFILKTEIWLRRNARTPGATPAHAMHPIEPPTPKAHHDF